MDLKKRKFGDLTPEQMKDAGLLEIKAMWEELAVELSAAKREREELREELRAVREERKAWSDTLKEFRETQEVAGAERKVINEKLDQMMELLKAGKEEQAGGSVNSGRNDLEERLRSVEKMEEARRKEERKNNIVITGSGKGNLERVWGLLEVEVDIVAAHELGKSGNMVLVETRCWEEKRKIMSAKRKLRGTNIFVDDDLTPEERRVQRELRLRAKEERKNGVEVWVGYRKMKIAGELWVWENDHLTKKV